MSISSIDISVTAGSACIPEISSSSGSSSPNSNLDSFARNPCFFGFFSSFPPSSGCTSAFALSASGISESSPVPLRIFINSSSSSDTAFSFSVSGSSSPKSSIPISSIARSSIPSSLAPSSFFTSAVSSFCSAVFSTADVSISAVSFAASWFTLSMIWSISSSIGCVAFVTPCELSSLSNSCSNCFKNSSGSLSFRSSCSNWSINRSLESGISIVSLVLFCGICSLLSISSGFTGSLSFKSDLPSTAFNNWSR